MESLALNRSVTYSTMGNSISRLEAMKNDGFDATFEAKLASYHACKDKERKASKENAGSPLHIDTDKDTSCANISGSTSSPHLKPLAKYQSRQKVREARVANEARAVKEGRVTKVKGTRVHRCGRRHVSMSDLRWVRGPALLRRNSTVT